MILCLYFVTDVATVAQRNINYFCGTICHLNKILLPSYFILAATTLCPLCLIAVDLIQHMYEVYIISLF